MENIKHRRFFISAMEEFVSHGAGAFPHIGKTFLQGAGVFPHNGKTFLQGAGIFPQVGETFLQGAGGFSPMWMDKFFADE